MKKYHAFNFLKKIYYVRTGGSIEERKAANTIKEEIASLGGEAYLEDFEVDYSRIDKAKLYFNDKSIEVEVAGSGYSGFTSDEGVTGELFYASSKEAYEMTSLKDKIIFSQTKRVPHPLYEKAIKDGAKGFILATGSVYKGDKDVDLDPYLNRELDYTLGKLPTVMARSRTIEKVFTKLPYNATIVLQGEDSKRNSCNVISDIKGTIYPDEVITLTAHYDSVSYSKGAYDNGTGVIALLHMYEYFMSHKPSRTLRFIFCGSEEMGLLGSKAYTSMHEEEVKEHVLFNVNIDMVAVTLGRDIVCVTGENEIVNYLTIMSKELGFPLHVYQDVYSSDSTPFADKGVPAVSFARLSVQGGATIHSHDDVIERLSEENFLTTMSFITEFVSRMVNAKCFPLVKSIPDNMKEAIDKYYQRKKDKK